MISLPRSCHHGWLQFRRRWSCHLPQDSWAAKVCAIPPNFCHSSGYPLVLKHGNSTSSIINGACLITGSVNCNPLTATSLEWCLVRAVSQNGRTCFGLLFRFVLIPEPKHLALGYQSARPVGTWNWAPLWTEALASIQVWTLAEGQSGARRHMSASIEKWNVVMKFSLQLCISFCTQMRCCLSILLTLRYCHVAMEGPSLMMSN